MPQHKSAKKRMKTNAKRQARNRSDKSQLRLDLRGIRGMEDEKRAEATGEIHSVLDKAAKKGIIHKNKAARLKSRLSS